MTTPFILLLSFTACVSCFAFSSLGMYVANQNGRAPIEGLVLGGLFGIFGVLIVLVLPKTQDKPQDIGLSYLKYGLFAAGILAVICAIPLSMSLYETVLDNPQWLY